MTFSLLSCVQGGPVLSNSPSLVQTAKLAYELSSQVWSDMNEPSEENQSIDILTERILAIFLIRTLAILSTKDMTPALPNFSDLSTSTICHTILNHQSSVGCDQISDTDDKTSAEVSSTGEQQDFLPENDFGVNSSLLQWPESITEEIIFQLHNYIQNILEGYRGVSYHNRAHAYHVFISAHKLLDMVLCECDYSKLMANQPIKKPHRSTFGLKKDPLIQLALLFSALVHDVDHTGVSNRQLVLESDELAIMYNDQSVAEQRSLAIAFSLLMSKDYQDLRSIFFYGDDYTRFRKVVIDLVLCTDIANPERVQIVKSKWKEAFGDRNKTEAPKIEFPKVPVPAEVNANTLRDSVRSSIGHEDALTRRNANVRNAALRRTLRRTSTLCPPARPPQTQKPKSMTFSQRKRRNAWKSEPADPSLGYVGKKRLLRQFFALRTSQIVMETNSRLDMPGEGEEKSSSDGSSAGYGVTDTDISIQKNIKKKKKKLLRIPKYFKDKAAKRRSKRDGGSHEPQPEPAPNPEPDLKHEKVRTVRDESQEPDLDREKRENVAPLLTSTTSPRYDSFRSSSNNIDSINGFLDQFSDDISESSGVSNATSIYVSSKERRKAKSNSMSHASKPAKIRKSDDKKKPPYSRESSGTSSSGNRFGSRRSSFKRIYRRFTEPPDSMLDRKKFHFRLGIRRALDLTGNQIDAYQKISQTNLNNDPDKPDEMKVIVVLEQLMKAADVAANMQDWDTMVTWCKRLFYEQKVRFEQISNVL